MPIEKKLLDLAASLVQQSSREQPIDALMRVQLKSIPVPRTETSQMVEAVFAYYRWLGFLNPEKPLSHNIETALELAAQFRKQPASFSDQDLTAKAIPNWIKDEMEVTP